MNLLALGDSEIVKSKAESAGNTVFTSVEEMKEKVADCDMIILTSSDESFTFDDAVNVLEDFDEACEKYDVDVRPVVLLNSEDLSQYINTLQQIYRGWFFFKHGDEVKVDGSEIVYDLSFLR